ncbi:MAG: surface lipoprotein assembly modifier [Halioglobus sp.]
MHSNFGHAPRSAHAIFHRLCSLSSHSYLLAMPLLAIYLNCAQALAQEEKNKKESPKFSADIAVGAEYDSNIAVEEVDRSSSETDYALTLSAGLGVQQKLNDSAKIGFSYDFNQNIYQNFSQVDRQTHILGGNLSKDLGKADAGLSLFYINSRLDGKPFLELSRISPSVSGFLSKKWFARGAYVYSDKTIEDRPERDAISNAAEADIYYFRRGLRSYLNIGYRFRDEDANSDPLDYTAHSLKLRYIQRVEVFSKLAKLELAWRYEDRDYQSDTASINEERGDQRHRWRLDFEIPVWGPGSAIQFYYGYSDYDSNLPQSDYNQAITGTRFVHRW